jgi:ADP-ribose pyrophosphatase YjhB (NUDIX family)
MGRRTLPLQSRWARLGPPDRKWFSHVPEGVVCISAFVIVRNRAGDVLLGRPRPHRDWPEKGCFPLWRLRVVERENRWILPASHFLMDESPARAAKRIARDWAGLAGVSPRLVTVESEVFDLGRWAGRGPTRRRLTHWALCFLYEVVTDRVPRKRPSWAELRFFPERELRKVRFGRDHDDIYRRYERAVGAR